jgi:hypothetical protein
MAALPPTNSTKPSKRSPAAQRQLRPPCKGVAASVAAWLSALVDSGTVLRCSPEDTRSASMPEATCARRRRHDANARVYSSSIPSVAAHLTRSFATKVRRRAAPFRRARWMLQVRAPRRITALFRVRETVVADTAEALVVHKLSSAVARLALTTPCLASNAFRSRPADLQFAAGNLRHWHGRGSLLPQVPRAAFAAYRCFICRRHALVARLTGEPRWCWPVCAHHP